MNVGLLLCGNRVECGVLKTFMTCTYFSEGMKFTLFLRGKKRLFQECFAKFRINCNKMMVKLLLIKNNLMKGIAF